MDFNILIIIFRAFFVSFVISSEVFAFKDNSAAALDRIVDEEHRLMRYINGELIQNTFESFYYLKSEDKDGAIRFEPLLSDYSFVFNFYADGSLMSPNLNPIRPYELHKAEFYFDSSALFPKTREQVFTDFFMKYNAVFAFLHFWITRFIIKHTIQLIPEDKRNISSTIFWARCDEMAYYSHWLINLEIDRHLDDRHFQKVIPAFETIIRTLKGLIEVEPFSSPSTMQLFEFGQKINPFNERIKPIRFVLEEEKWMKILRFVEEMKIKKKTYVNPEILLKNLYDDYDGKIRTDYLKDPKKFMKDLHDYSWSAIKIILGREFFILESFFYSTLTGVDYPLAHSFVQPSFPYTTDLWKNIECLYLIWNPMTIQKHKSDYTCDNSEKNDHFKIFKQPNKIFLAAVLRELNRLRFRFFLFADYEAFGADFSLKTCDQCIFLKCRCFGGFRMVDNSKS